MEYIYDFVPQCEADRRFLFPEINQEAVKLTEAFAIMLAVPREITEEDRKRREKKLTEITDTLFRKNHFVGRISDLERRLNLNPTTVARIIDRLLADNIIESKETPIGNIYQLKTE